MKRKTTNSQEPDWEATTWEGARREQLRRWSRLTLEQIIMAQEEMADLSDRLAGTSSKNTQRRPED